MSLCRNTALECSPSEAEHDDYLALFKQIHRVTDDLHSQRILTPENYAESLLNPDPTLILLCLVVAGSQEEGKQILADGDRAPDSRPWSRVWAILSAIFVTLPFCLWLHDDKEAAVPVSIKSTLHIGKKRDRKYQQPCLFIQEQKVSEKAWKDFCWYLLAGTVPQPLSC